MTAAVVVPGGVVPGGVIPGGVVPGGNRSVDRGERGVALLAVLFALTLLALLALPFAVSMGVGADAAVRDVEQAQVEQGSASARDLLLADAALSHPAFDPTPTYDELAEFPDHVELPQKFDLLREEGRVLLGGAVWDQQRFLALDGASPLMFANVLGTTTRLASELAPDAGAVVLEDASRWPDSGYLWLAGEVIHYGHKQGNSLGDLLRSQFVDQGFVKQEQTVVESTLALDFRCVLAAEWPFARGDGTRKVRRAFASVGELAEVASAGLGSFTAEELDRLEAAFSVDTLATTSATWGRPETVFDSLEPGANSLRVKSALHIGAGSTVRLRDQKSGAVEYALVMTAMNEQFARDLHLPSLYRLTLLRPVLQAFSAIDSVVEPLVPVPVNVNTAVADVLTAVFAEVRRAPAVKVHDGDNRQRQTPLRGISHAEAQTLAEEIVALRAGDPQTPGQGPFRGWQDFCERLLKPRFEAAKNDTDKLPWLVLYRDLHTGRDSQLEMGTSPVTFASGPWVGYRAGASRSRSSVAPGVAARHERTGVAAAVPGFPIEREWNTQEQLEDAFTLDRRAPGWATTPVNLGALLVDQSGNGEGGNDPASRYFPHVVPMAFPGGDFGAPRFPSTDTAEAVVTPSPSISVPRQWAREMLRHDSFAMGLDPRGRDMAKEGPYQMTNVGPRGDGSAAPSGGRHDRITFPFANQDGFASRFAVSAWFEPQSFTGTTLFEHGGDDELRNRLWLHTRDGNLTLEVIDEAGIDPAPSESPAGVERTATQWRVPLADLALPANTPVHVGFSAFGSRPSELSLAVDGIPRGKPKYTTYLTASLPVFDPSLANNTGALPPTSGNDRYIDVQVESTDGFPPVGTLRIGTELFEYSSIKGNSFQCRFADSLGGRGARQAGIEFRPAIPVDSNGKPTVDVASLQQQGVNLDVFPEHPAGSQVELYGYSTLLSEDSPMMPGTTRLEASIGAFAVARGYVQNARPIAITPLPPRPPLPIGQGIDETWSGDLLLADPVPTGTTQPGAASAVISDAFPTGGGYALLVQIGFDLNLDELGALSAAVATGGVELIRYSARSGNKLSSVQRAQTIPGVDAQIAKNQYDGTAHKFVTQWEPWLETRDRIKFQDLPTAILWVVPVSLPVMSTQQLWDPAASGLLEWVQLYSKDTPNDTEWVRYDAIVGNKHLVRGNRNAWDRLRYALTNATGRTNVGITRQGGTTSTNVALSGAAWGNVTATSGFIGYVPELESLYPQIQAARGALRFRGDPFTRTSSHPQTSPVVMQCQRLQLNWGNFGAYDGRPGRHDRIAIVQGSKANGTQRPDVEWHSVNWVCRRYNADNLAQNKAPVERYGPWPFQLVAFTDGVKGAFLGPPRGTLVLEPRKFDRVVKFPSGELPAAYCENVYLGSGLGKANPVGGYLDEVDVVSHFADDLVVDEVFAASGKVLKTVPGLTVNANGPVMAEGDRSAPYPQGGGLLWIDGEIVGYQSRSNGEFTIATNGRGLLGTEVRDHDRGARVHFLTHRPAAVLASQVGSRENLVAVQALGAMPVAGTARLGNELLHYTWTRQSGDRATLEMPRWYPPGEDEHSPSARGLFRGRFGTTPGTGGAGEMVISWPFRYWDRFAEQSDDPELAYFQFTLTEAPSFWKTLNWREESRDPRVDVVCLVRTDSKAPWTGDPAATPGLWKFTREAGDEKGAVIGAQASRLEVRFAATYKPGVVDLLSGREHAWKTTVRVDKVRVAYEGQTRIVDERETAR